MSSDQPEIQVTPWPTTHRELALTGVPDERAGAATRLTSWGGRERLLWILLLAATALVYLWNLSISGLANEYYAAAAQAGSESWKALFFGSLDAGGSITVDKPPLSLWPMALSVKIFGLSSWSLLVPQAVEGVASVALLHATVRRSTACSGAALLAGSVFAFTPIAVLMFRYDNPDALLTMLLVAAAYATVRALEGDRAVRWLALAGALVGTAFMDKLLQAFIVLPALVIAYLVFATVPFWRRAAHLLVAFGTLTAAASWWLLTVDLWPASSRPWIGGSSHNSVLELALGYNGIGRLTGNDGASTGYASSWHGTNLSRMSGVFVGTGVMWLMPAAMLLGVGGLWVTRRRAECRSARAALTLWLVWLVVNLLVFSLMAGIFHAYYTIVLAPAIGALVGVGGHVLWQARRRLAAPVILAIASASTTLVAMVLQSVHPGQLRWLTPIIVVLGIASMLLLVIEALPRRLRAAVMLVALLAGLVGPVTYSLVTASVAHSGSGPQPGPVPAVTNAAVSPDLLHALGEDPGHHRWLAAVGGARSAAPLQLATGRPVLAIGGYKGTDPAPSLREFVKWVDEGRIHYFVSGGTTGAALSAIDVWVFAHHVGTRIGPVLVYDLTARS